MREAVVADSACLIALERIGRLDLLQSLFDSVFIPPEVRREFGTDLPWLRIEAPADRKLVTTLQMLVDSGEAEAIALASDMDVPIILDDLKARTVARGLGLSIIGTVAILVRAKRAGFISAVNPLIGELEGAGFRLGAALKREVLRLAGK
ncbi:MAG TPA: DUF3368 domain-containing protein [Thermoanaerobaculia bacterium]|nr:DUF3368 domain-containing protein [Thermoanaerobaculia bacterium]